MNTRVRDIFVFFAGAFGLTFLASQLPELTIGKFGVNLVLCGLGPLLSGLACYSLLKTKNETGISILGTRPVITASVCLAPVLTLYVTQEHRFTAILLFVMPHFAYCFGEEFGWRHYLQNATSHLDEWRQSFLIGLLWFMWHFSFLEDVSSSMLGSDMPIYMFAPLMIVLLSLLSYLFGIMVKRSGSVLFPTVGHLLFKTGMTTMLVAGVLMALTLVLWDRIPGGKKHDTKTL